MTQSRFQEILISIFRPFLWYCFRRPDSSENVISYACDNEPSEEIEAIDVSGTNGDSLTNRTRKPDNVNNNAENICNLHLAYIEEEYTYALGLIPPKYQYGPSRSDE